MPHPRRLTDDQVAAALAAASRGVSRRELGRRLGVSRTVIDRLVQNGGYVDPLSPEQHLTANSVRDPATGCLLWTAHLMANGYATFAFHGAGAKSLVHREAHEVWIGPIPVGYVVDHLCPMAAPNRHCIEPTHLEAVTQAENVRRMHARRRAFGMPSWTSNTRRDLTTGRYL